MKKKRTKGTRYLVWMDTAHSFHVSSLDVRRRGRDCQRSSGDGTWRTELRAEERWQQS
jgi:hypothetical protein